MRLNPRENGILVANLPRIVVLSTLALLVNGLIAGVAWWATGSPVWIRLFFSYPGALFFITASITQVWLSFQCASLFSAHDLLRPAWVLIGFSALARLAGDVVRLAGLEWHLLFNPLYMLFLAFGLFRVLKACRQNGICARLTVIDILLVGSVIVYTVDFFATVVFVPVARHPGISIQKILSWTSDPLLCILLLEAILIHRSVSNMGRGLIARCWLSFTAAIFATSLGDIGLWAWSKGYLPEILQAASWFIWFLASAAYALGPAYQLQAMRQATVLDDTSVRDERRAYLSEFADK